MRLMIVCLLDAAGPIEHAIARETLSVERHERAGCRADVVVRRVRAARLGLARLLAEALRAVVVEATQSRFK